MRMPLVFVHLAVLGLVACASDVEAGLPNEPTADRTAMEPAVIVPDEAISNARKATAVVAQADADDRYRDCLLAHEFDPEGVQVLLDDSGKPWWVKTGHDSLTPQRDHLR